MARHLVLHLLLAACHVGALLSSFAPSHGCHPPGSPLTSEPSEPEGRGGAAVFWEDAHAGDDWMLPPTDATGSSYPPWSNELPEVYGSALASPPPPAAPPSPRAAYSAPRQRLCQSCHILDAKKGVEASDGSWAHMLCKLCSKQYSGCVDLAHRCVECRRWASYGAPGTGRSESVHCRLHRRHGEASLTGYVKKRSASSRSLSSSASAVSSAEEREWADSDGSSVSPRGVFGRKGRDMVLLGHNEHPSRGCSEAGCRFRGTYQSKGGGGGRLCRTHRQPDSVLLDQRLCVGGGGDCPKRAHYGDPSGLEAPLYCAAHKEGHHVNLKSRRCESDGCERQPSFGDVAEGTPRFCREHRREGDANVRHTRCEHASCLKIPAFGLLGGGPARFCASHKPLDAVNVRRSRSSTPGVAGGREGEDVRTLLSHEACAEETLRRLLRAAAGGGVDSRLVA